ncbi:sulfotransferase family protein [Arhodomonas aquaeolei]|uniref:sulfotransferase family protein n=1 Tax=Arhodomonas aquaeolei TaxID=2369 RepID=UPI00035F39DC|nr:sulfotransferase [Arhodomonas aquaeolei]
MTDDLRFHAPVMILGAPRSGTSLLHRILRGHPGFVSTARESQPVWEPLTEPSRHDWAGEQAPGDLQSGDIDGIHRQLARLALPADVWRRADARDVVAKQQNPILSRWVLRPGYRALVMARALRWRSTLHSWLVDKCVHSGLWPELLETAFPDARYIHIVRDPADTMRSMVSGWLNPDRFFTWEPPQGLAIPDYPFTRWNFPLPPGWQEVRDRPLAEVVAFQWRAMQEGILGLESRTPTERFLRVRLENLNARPRETIEQIAAFLQLPWSDYLETFAGRVPVVNAEGKHQPPGKLATTVEEILPSIRDTARRLGYD